jgi:hypothetical protein
MWPRVVEIMFGCWLLVTPFVFRTTTAIDDYAGHAVLSGALIAAASMLGCWPPLRHAHLATLSVAAWLTLHGYFSAARPGPPAAQNEIVVGLIVLLFAILPNEVNQAPRSWRNSGGSSSRGPL